MSRIQKLEFPARDGLGMLPDRSPSYIDTGYQLPDKRIRLLKDLPSHRDSMGIAHGRSDIFAAMSQCVESETNIARPYFCQ